MARERESRAPYVVPRYRAEGDPAWYHVLHGTVPGHEIDFICCPAVPQGLLTQTHFAHVARLMKYIEPREKAAFGFAIGNLSRDDTQHEPGHGGLALIFCLRVEGVVDHASRAMPPYAHGLLAIDRAMDYRTLIEAATTFHRHFLPEGPSDATGSFYRAYVERMRNQPASVEKLLAEHIAELDELPQPRRSELGADFVATKDAVRDRITIVHPDNEPFSTVASVAAALASILYRSNVKWTTISSGREIDIPGGVSIRFVPESEAPRDSAGVVLRLDEVPGDEAEIAEMLFSAKPRTTGAPRREGWREQYAKKAGLPISGAGAPAVTDPAAETVAAHGETPSDSRPVALASSDAADDLVPPKPRKAGLALIGGALAAAAMAAVVTMSGSRQTESETTAGPTAADSSPSKSVQSSQAAASSSPENPPGSSGGPGTVASPEKTSRSASSPAASPITRSTAKVPVIVRPAKPISAGLKVPAASHPPSPPNPSTPSSVLDEEGL